MDKSKLANKSLEEIRTDVSLNEANIIFHQNEIKRIESLIVTFETCIKEQNVALNCYILERVKLKTEKSNFKAMKLSASSAHSIADTEDTFSSKDTMSELSRSSKKRKSTDNIKDEMLLKSPHTSNKIVKMENLESLKSESGFGSAENVGNIDILGCNNGSISDKDSTKTEPTIKTRRKWNLHNYRNRKVYQMLVHNQRTFLCGSRGMLLMIEDNETIAIDADTAEDIQQMTFFKYNSTLSLAAFSTNHVIIFLDILKIQSAEKHDVSVTGNIFVDKSGIFLPVAGGEIKKLITSSCKMVSLIKHSHERIRFLVPNRQKNDGKTMSMIGLEDRKLYRTLDEEFDILEEILGICNVKNLLALGKEKFLCYSKRKLWILNNDQTIEQTMKFKDGIKYVACKDAMIVVINCANKMWIYEDQSDDGSVKILYEQQFDQKITTATIHKDKIFLLIADEILILKITK